MILRPCRSFALRLLALILASALASACASVKSIPDKGVSAEMKMRRPGTIYIEGFNTTHGRWEGRAAQPELRTEIRLQLTAHLERHLAHIAPTRLLTGERPHSGWLITGHFLRANPGSRVGRMFLGGIGAGASKLETKVQVFDLAVSSLDPILSFTTSGGSNLAAGPTGVFAGIDDDVERTAREIEGYLEAHLWPANTNEGRPLPSDSLQTIEVLPVLPPDAAPAPADLK